MMVLISYVYLLRKLLQESADEGVYMRVRKGQNQRQLFIANDTDPREQKYSVSLGILNA